jgi:hypothetical protein
VHWEIDFDSFPIDFEKLQMLFRKPTSWEKIYKDTKEISMNFI